MRMGLLALTSVACWREQRDPVHTLLKNHALVCGRQRRRWLRCKYAVTSKNASLLRRGDLKSPERSEPQAQAGLERPDVPVPTAPFGCGAVTRCRRS